MSSPLPSWRPGTTRDAILEFLEAVTNENGPDSTPPAERIAVFDNDGSCGASSRSRCRFCSAKIGSGNWLSLTRRCESKKPFEPS